jgi:hypothetical protein
MSGMHLHRPVVKRQLYRNNAKMGKQKCNIMDSENNNNNKTFFLHTHIDVFKLR